MESSQLFTFFNSQTMTNITFKIVAIFLALFYLLYSLIIGKQVSIMHKSLEDSFNSWIALACSLQTAIAFILLIFTIFLL